MSLKLAITWDGVKTWESIAKTVEPVHYTDSRFVYCYSLFRVGFDEYRTQCYALQGCSGVEQVMFLKLGSLLKTQLLYKSRRTVLHV